jgi:hypothetical protein
MQQYTVHMSDSLAGGLIYKQKTVLLPHPGMQAGRYIQADIFKLNELLIAGGRRSA